MRPSASQPPPEATICYSHHLAAWSGRDSFLRRCDHRSRWEAAFVHADVSDAGQAEAMVRFAVETFGGLHILYNNAGIVPEDDAGTLETPAATGDRVRAVNLEGVWLGMKFGIPALLASGGGTIVNH